MPVLGVVALAALSLVVAYLTYGRWLARRVFGLDASAATPACAREDDQDFVPTKKSVVFGHHFTSIAGTGPIVGPAIAVMWGWLPALLWVVVGSIFIGMLHDLGSLVVSLRNKGRTLGDIAGDLLGPRARVLFLAILIVGLWIVLAVFGLVIAAVLKQYPAAVTPVVAQVPLALLIGVFIHRKGRSIVVPSLIALAVMLGTVWLGAAAETLHSLGGMGVPPVASSSTTSFFAPAFLHPLLNAIHWFNVTLAALPVWVWTAGLLLYAYVASVLPVWTLLQPRDYINALQLVLSLGLIVLGLVAAAVFGGAAIPDVLPVAGEGAAEMGGAGMGVAERLPLEFVAPVLEMNPAGAPPLLPMLFITIACGACSGFHCLVASGTTSKQVRCETHARPVAAGSMLVEGFLAVLVIAACAAGLGLGVHVHDRISLATTTRPLALPLDATTITVELAWREPTTGRRLSSDIHLLALFVQPKYCLYLPHDNGSGTLLQFTSTHNLDRYFLSATPVDSGNILQVAGELIGVSEVEINERPARKIATGSAIDLLTVHDGLSSAMWTPANEDELTLTGQWAFASQYTSWQAAGSLGRTVGAFVQGSGNFLAALGIPIALATALMAVMVAAFAATTMDTACRLQRYVIQELSALFLPKRKAGDCPACGYDCGGGEEGIRDPGSGIRKDEEEEGTRHQAPGTSGEEGIRDQASGSSGERREGEHLSLSRHREGAGSAFIEAGNERATESITKAPDARCPVPGASLTRCPECGTAFDPGIANAHSIGVRRRAARWFNPFKWLATVHGATVFAVVSAFVLAMGPVPSAVLPTGASGWWAQVSADLALWFEQGGRGGLILWPLFGATNQLLAGLAFLVVIAWLRSKRKPVWFAVPPMVLMLVMPAWAMSWQAFVGNEANPSWWAQSNWLLVGIAIATLALEAWLIVEAVLRWRAVGAGARSPDAQSAREPA